MNWEIRRNLYGRFVRCTGKSTGDNTAGDSGRAASERTLDIFEIRPITVPLRCGSLKLVPCIHRGNLCSGASSIYLVGPVIILSVYNIEQAWA